METISNDLFLDGFLEHDAQLHEQCIKVDDLVVVRILAAEIRCIQGLAICIIQRFLLSTDDLLRGQVQFSVRHDEPPLYSLATRVALPSRAEVILTLRTQ